mgnify:CR=1 FL=1
MKTAEVSFASGDSIQQLDPNIFKHYEYIVAKLPSGEIKLLHELEKLDFMFLEAQFDLSIHFDNSIRTAKSSDVLMSRITSTPIETTEKIIKLTQQITPELFQVDRISIDPELGKEVGAIRYKNWILDEYKNGKIFAHEIMLGSTPIGFFILKELSANRLFSLLAGLYSPFKNKGLGLSIVQKPIDWAKEHNYREISTRNSSNNSESFKIHLACGYRLDAISYILRWKRKEKTEQGDTYVDDRSSATDLL